MHVLEFLRFWGFQVLKFINSKFSKFLSFSTRPVTGCYLPAQNAPMHPNAAQIGPSNPPEACQEHPTATQERAQERPKSHPVLLWQFLSSISTSTILSVQYIQFCQNLQYLIFRFCKFIYRIEGIADSGRTGQIVLKSCSLTIADFEPPGRPRTHVEIYPACKKGAPHQAFLRNQEQP